MLRNNNTSDSKMILCRKINADGYKNSDNNQRLSTSLLSHNVCRKVLIQIWSFWCFRKMALLVPLITSYIAFFSHNKIASSSVTIRRIDENLTFVPQDITTDVSVLKLDKNLIQVLYNTSFSMYRRLQMLTLSDNPLWKIHNGTFDNNLSLGHFFCENCNIKILPSSFGPSSSRISSLRLGSGISKDAMVSPYFDSFVSLTTLRLNSNGLSNIDVINMPPSIKILSLYLNRIAEFPNVSFARFPILSSLNIEVNYLKHVSNSTLAGISNTLTLLSLYRNRLLDIGNLTVLTNLRIVGLERNQLETIPDMLGLSQLRSLYIDGNTRMTCDHRMCWRRLWDRVRAPLFSSDDATCKAPLAARGHSLSRINPGFMQCDQGDGFYCQIHLSQGHKLI